MGSGPVRCALNLKTLDCNDKGLIHRDRSQRGGKMGWWSQDKDGYSFVEESEMVWGDGPRMQSERP